MLRKSIVSSALAVALVVASPALAAGASPSNAFTLNVTSAKISVAGLPAFPIDSAQVATTPISISGTAADDGALSAPASGVAFPSLKVPIPQELITQLASALGSAGTLPTVGGFDIGALLKSGSLSASVGAAIKASGPATGTVSRSTGAISLSAPLDLQVSLNASFLFFKDLPLITCQLPGLAFAFRTDTSGLSTGSALSAQPYDSITKKAVLAAEASIPKPTCSGLLASLLGGSLDQLGALQLGKVGLQLNTDVTLPPPAEASLPGTSKLRISSSGQIQQKVACTKTRSCRGTLVAKLEDGTLLATKSFTVSAGKSSTLKVTLAKSLKSRMKTAPTMIGLIVASVSSGADVVKNVSLTRPASWR